MPDLSLAGELALVFAGVAVVAGAGWAFLALRRRSLPNDDHVVPPLSFEAQPDESDASMGYEVTNRSPRYRPRLDARLDLLATLEAIAENGAPNVTLRVNGDDGIVALGSEVALSLHSTARAYLSLLDVDSAGRITLLAPMRSGHALLSRAGATLAFPGPTDPRWTPARAGPHSAFALATPRPIPHEWLVQATSGPDPFYELDPQEAWKLAKRLDAIVAKLEGNQFSAARCNWEVREPAASEVLVRVPEKIDGPNSDISADALDELLKAPLGSRGTRRGPRRGDAAGLPAAARYDLTVTRHWPVVPDEDELQISLDLMSVPDPETRH